MRLTSLTVAAGLALASASFAETVAPGNVVFDEYGAVEASLTGVAGDPANGRSVIVSKKTR
jgi:sulfur-oxidizing protein SoxX